MTQQAEPQVRILITGSRTWDDRGAVEHQIRMVCAKYDPRALVIVHGACNRGADWYADQYARRRGLAVERHPADWKKYGRAAGPRRNAEMVAAGADVCLAFIRDGSVGATHTADLAEKAGIPVRRWTA